MKLDVYSHCVIDNIQFGNDSHEKIGGPACYCSHTAKKFKFDVCLHTRFGPDFASKQYLDDFGISYNDCLADTPTTRFRILIKGSDRDMYIENRCGPIAHTSSSPDGIIISPVFDEIDSDTFNAVKKDAGFVLLDPQGFLRSAGPDNKIFLKETDIDMTSVSAIKVNPEEMEKIVGRSDVTGMKMLQKRGAKCILRINKTEISMLEGDRLYTLKMPNVDFYDTTGVGDIFGAAFACTMLKEKDAIWGLCFAGGAAQAALSSKEVGLQKVPQSGATTTNASYFYNLLDFEQV